MTNNTDQRGNTDQRDDTGRSGFDAEAVGLRALVWTLAVPERAMRLLDVTGLDPRDLRRRASDPAVLAATLEFLEAHEPDLVACADELGLKPGDLVRAREGLPS